MEQCHPDGIQAGHHALCTSHIRQKGTVHRSDTVGETRDCRKSSGYTLFGSQCTHNRLGLTSRSAPRRKVHPLPIEQRNTGKTPNSISLTYADEWPARSQPLADGAATSRQKLMRCKQSYFLYRIFFIPSIINLSLTSNKKTPYKIIPKVICIHNARNLSETSIPTLHTIIAIHNDIPK